MAIVENKLTAQMDTTNASSYTTASISPASNRLVLFAVLTHVNTGVDTFITALSGAGMNWFEIAHIAADNSGAGRNAVGLWRALEASPGSGTVTITPSGACISCGWSIIEFSGIDTSGTSGSGAIAESNSNRAATGTTGSVTLTDFDSNNAIYGAVVHGATEDIVPGAAFVQLDEISTVDGSALNTEWDNPATTNVADWTWATSLPWGAIAVEIQAAAAPPPVSARESRGRIMTSRGTAW